jgi:hypothetical protein
MDVRHIFSKKINFFWLKKCVHCRKIKSFKQLYHCSCGTLCHKKCHIKFIQMEKTNKIPVVQSSIQHDTTEDKGDGLVIIEKDQNLTNQVQNTSLVVNILQINQ